MERLKETWKRWLAGGDATEPSLCRLLLEHYPGAVMLLDADGVVRQVNPDFERHAGHPAERLLGRRAVSLDIDPLHGDFARALERCLTTRRPWQGVLLCRRADGSLRHQTTMIQPLADGDATPLRLLVVQYDVTGMRERELRDRQLLARLDSLVSQVPGVLFRLRQSADGHLEFLYLSERVAELTGLGADRLMGDAEPFLDRLPADYRERLTAALAQSAVSLEPWQLEFRLSLPAGECWLEARAEPQRRREGGTLWDGMMFDITERKRLEERVQRLVGTDMLTGALNRRAFFEQGEAALARAGRLGQRLSLAMLDLDHFKYLNDTYGHPAGDLALQAFVRTCRDSLRPYDLIARIGGEEFSVMLLDSTPEEAWTVLERLRRAVEAIELEVDGRVIHFTVSLGVTVLEPGATLEGGLALADQALYRAKRDGRNRIGAPAWLGPSGTGDDGA
ncbi:sensor domain-containing diguanylate cyclase [Halomonas ramblicola]|uniref:sensor domain-containing diguanylate cyclase n=1 Tax=Halomonas ramblicola TaxID=747349 RepID=UPI0025B58135|nr:diguanylate cyclase [Halomonas ramblicola]MDN3523274.1 diguanylate cyclase [Halomonas ramblicola]